MKTFFKDLGQGIKNVFKGPAQKENLFKLDNRAPLGSAIPFGIQHVLAMFAGNIAPIIIVLSAIGLYNSSFATYSILGALFMAGLGTIIQLLIGSRLPVVSGTSFAFVPILCAIGIDSGGGEAAYYTIMGSIIVGGLFAIIFSLLYRFWGKLVKSIVPAIVILGVGLSLVASGANSFFGGEAVISSVISTGQTPSGVPYFCYIIVAFVTIISALLWSLLFKGVWKNINIIVGIAVGFIVSCCIPGMVNFSSMAIDANDLIGPHGIFDFPHFLDVSKLRFELVPCLLTATCFIVTVIEGIGNTTAVAKAGLEREPTKREIMGAITTDGFNATIGAFFGALPLTTFSENVGIVAQTKVINRSAIFVGALFLILAGLFPPIANFILAIPDVVIGGTMVVLFGTIVVIGMKTISVIGWSDKNVIITAVSVCLGFGITIATVTTDLGISKSTTLFDGLGVGWLGDLLSSCVLNMFIIAFILSWVLPESMYIPLFHKKGK